MLHSILIFTGGLATCFWMYSCSNESNPNKQQPVAVKKQSALPPAPVFNEDSAYSFVKAQVDFGPRIPGTNSHAKCAEYLFSKLKSFGWDVQIQNANITTHDGKRFNLKNIIASYRPEDANRILPYSRIIYQDIKLAELGFDPVKQLTNTAVITNVTAFLIDKGAAKRMVCYRTTYGDNGHFSLN